MTDAESRRIVDYAAGVYGLRADAQRYTSWHDQIGDLDFEPCWQAVRAVMRDQETHGWPLIRDIRARLAGANPATSAGISPAVRHVRGCDRCRDGLVILAQSAARDESSGRETYQYAYRCRCPAGRARPERFPYVPDWALAEPPPERKAVAAGERRPVQQIFTEAARATAMKLHATAAEDELPF
jgi:hypothetical protein